jgi:hypothetical protein
LVEAVLGHSFAVLRGLSVAAAISTATIAAPALAQSTADPRVLRIDDTGVVLFDGMVTIAHQDTYRVESARTEVDDGMPVATVDISFTAADLAGGRCKLEMGRTDEADLEVVRASLTDVLSRFEADMRHRSSASAAGQARILTHGNSNSINSERPYISTYATSQQGGLEVSQYWFTSYNGRIHGYINECTLPGRADQARLRSELPLRTRP